MSTWARTLAVAVCCAYPLLNHAAAVLHEPRWAALGIALVAWGLAAGWLSGAASVLCAAAVLALTMWLAGRLPALLLFVPPLAINLALFSFFACTLRPGRDALISSFVRVERGGQLPPDLERYTRNLTGLWAGFFVTMAAASAILAATAPLAAWSLFTNILNYVLVVMFFILEYLYRRVRYRHHAHASPWQMIRMLRKFKLNPPSQRQAL
jgi:uncharacterized membrane protein